MQNLLTRPAAYQIRSMIHTAEGTIEKKDRSQVAEWERDLCAQAACAIWDGKLNSLVSCLRRLQRHATDRQMVWALLYASTVEILTGKKKDFPACFQAA